MTHLHCSAEGDNQGYGEKPPLPNGTKIWKRVIATNPFQPIFFCPPELDSWVGCGDKTYRAHHCPSTEQNLPLSFPPFWMLDKKRQSSRRLPRALTPRGCPGCAEVAVPHSTSISSPMVRENCEFVCQGANCASPWGSSATVPLKKERKQHFKNPVLNKTAAGRLLD